MSEPISVKIFWVGKLNKAGEITSVTDGPFTSYYDAAENISKRVWSSHKYVVMVSAEQMRKMSDVEIREEEGVPK